MLPELTAKSSRLGKDKAKDSGTRTQQKGPAGPGIFSGCSNTITVFQVSDLYRIIYKIILFWSSTVHFQQRLTIIMTKNSKHGIENAPQ